MSAPLSAAEAPRNPDDSTKQNIASARRRTRQRPRRGRRQSHRHSGRTNRPWTATRAGGDVSGARRASVKLRVVEHLPQARFDAPARSGRERADLHRRRCGRRDTVVRQEDTDEGAERSRRALGDAGGNLRRGGGHTRGRRCSRWCGARAAALGVGLPGVPSRSYSAGRGAIFGSGRSRDVEHGEIITAEDSQQPTPPWARVRRAGGSRKHGHRARTRPVFATIRRLSLRTARNTPA